MAHASSFSVSRNLCMRPISNVRWLCQSLLLFGATACGAVSGCDHASPSNAVQAEPAVAKRVAVVQARLESWPETIRIQGSMLAYEDATIGSKLAGRVESVAVDLGSIVKRGDPLVTLMRDELDLRVQLAEAQLRQACAAIGITPDTDESKFQFQNAPGAMMEQALVNEAQRNVERARSLLASRAMSEGEYDTLVAQLRAAQARYNAALNTVGEQVSMIGVRRKELALAQQMVADSRIVAPFEGVVGERRVSPGEYVQPGQAVVTLVRSDRLRFTAGVPESRAASIRVGQQVAIESTQPGAAPLVTAVSRVSPTVMQSSRSILIEADVPNPTLALQAGLFAEAEVVVDPDAQAIVVPASAVTRFAGVQKVWIVAGGVAKQQTVRTGREDGKRVEILEGLTPEGVLVRNAADGHDGPIIAVEDSSRANLQVNVPETSAAAPKTSSGGAQ
jgi:RND family efflux transporter MFP subunit